MHNKKILIAIPAESIDSGVFNLISNCLTGENIHLLVNVYQTKGHSDSTLVHIDKLSKLCVSKSITLRIQILQTGALARLSHRSIFADLIIIHRDLLDDSHFARAYGKVTSPVLVLPAKFDSINHVVLTADGTPETIRIIKQFTQLFARQIKNINVTLIYVMDDIFETSDEVLLIDYLKGFFKELGVLKILKPLTERELKPVKYDEHTLFVSTCTSLISCYDTGFMSPATIDKKSLIFLASQA